MGKYYSPAPIPTGDRILDVDLHTAGTSWLLLSVPCHTGRCAQLANSDDRGRTWHRLPVTTIAAGDWGTGCPPACSVRQVRFVDQRDGYLFSPGLFLTTDGGRTWHDAHPSAAAAGIGVANGVVVRASDGWCQKSADSCDTSVDHADPGSNDWTRSGTPEFGYPEYLDVFSQETHGPVYVARWDNLAGGVAHPPVLARTDDGRTWQEIPDPCADSKKVAIALATDHQRVAVLCMQHGGSESTTVRMSSDAGAHFSIAQPTTSRTPGP